MRFLGASVYPVDSTQRAVLADVEAKKFAECLGAALRAVKPESNVAGWQADIADACLSDESSVKRWQSGTTAPESWRARLLYRHLGQAFEDRVNERESNPPNTVSTDLIEALDNGIESLGAIRRRITRGGG